MSGQARRAGAWAGVLTATCVVFGACTYDFDKYVTPRGNASGHANAAGTAGAGAGRAGSPSGGSTSGHAGIGASATTGGANNANAGEGGAANEGGVGATPSGGGAAGRGGTATGGTATAGTSAGGAGAGGKATAGAPGGGSGGAAPVACTDGTTHDGHCYFLVGTSGGLDWEHAKTECEASGAHLVTITSSGEQSFVASSFFPSPDDAWIGLGLEDTTSDPSSLCSLLPDTCPFLWVTGEPLDYTAWAMRSGNDDEPNYTGACVRLQASDQAWADMSCTSTFRAVCERDP